jgi:GT2 family glycosyltransferase/glycosyltransferase involved in cell wall biosynthesis
VQVDVVIVGHESADHIERAIGELPEYARVFVIDNASTDETAARARTAGAQVVVNDVNAGFAAGANQGAALGSAAAILFLNPDAAIAPEILDRLLDELDRDPALAVLSPRVRYADGTEQRVQWPFPTSRGAWREALGIHRLGRANPAGFVIGACFLVRRAVFEQLEGFDTRYWLYGEETDLCARAVDAGWRVRVSAHAWAQHVGGASRDTAPSLAAEHFERGGERFVVDRQGTGGLVSYRLAKAVGSLVRWLVPGSGARRALHGARLDRYACVLAKSPTRVALDSPATRALGHALVVCSLEPWDDVWRRNQFLVRELLATDPHLRVLFVEPPFDWAHELRRSPRTRTRRRGLRSVRGDGRLLALEPGKVAPRVFGPFANRSLVRQVRAAVDQLGFDRPTLWINDSNFVDLLWTGWPAIYDITDDWLLASASARARRRLEAAERRLLRDAHGVVVCSAALAESRRAQRRDVTLIPNAVDHEHFTRSRLRPDDLPMGSVAVYVGSLHEDRVDVDLVDALACTYTDLEVVLVGPNSFGPSSSERLTARPNVHILGPRAYEDVPAYLQHADVVIVPHVVSPFTESLDPIKAYECVAVGRPTVATPVAGFRDLGKPVVVADTREFIAAVETALASAVEPALGSVPSWNERAEQFAAVLRRVRGSEVDA